MRRAGIAIACGLAVALTAAPSVGTGPPSPSGAPADALPPLALAWPAGELEAGTSHGFAWQRLRTRGEGEANLVLTPPLAAPLDLRQRFVELWLKLDAVERLRGLELRLFSGEGDSHFAFDLPLYADPEANWVRSGDWSRLTFGFAGARTVGAPDRGAITRVGFYVSDSGQPVQVWWSGIAVREQRSEGVVSLSFDDGYDEHHDAARWMARHGFRGTAYVIPESVGVAGYMTLDQLRELRDRFGWEVAAHHAIPFTDFEPGALEEAILGVRGFLCAHGFARGADHLAYPLGKQDEHVVRRLARKHFATARIAGGGFETLPPADPHRLRVVNVLPSLRPDEIGRAARRARENGEWLILMFHYLPREARGPTTYAIRDFQRALEAIAASGARVLPVGEVFEAQRLAERAAPASVGAGGER